MTRDMNYTRIGVMALSVAALVPATTGSTQEWTRFRGPNGSGQGVGESIPTTWGEGDDNWTTDLPGSGHSQPVVWDDRVYVLSAEREGASRLVLAFRVDDGELLWKKTVASSTHRKHSRNSYASTTPAVDATGVYVVFGSPRRLLVLSFDHEGEIRWERDLGPFIAQHGHGASPTIHGDVLIVTAEQGEGGTSFVAALEKKTGDTRWRTERDVARASYSTPCVRQRPDSPAEIILTSQAHGVYSLNAETGAPLWESKVFDKRTVSSPVIAGDLFIGSCGSGGGGNYVAAVRRGGRVAYTIRRSAPYVPTPVFKGGLLFLWSDVGGIVTCARATDGEVLWRERVGGNFSASPVCVGDRLYGVSDDGEVIVLAATDRFQVLGRSSLGEHTRTTPAVAGGRMYFRTVSRLMSIGGAETSG